MRIRLISVYWSVILAVCLLAGCVYPTGDDGDSTVPLLASIGFDPAFPIVSQVVQFQTNQLEIQFRANGILETVQPRHCRIQAIAMRQREPKL